MDFDSPDVMKDFPGLYASELNKQCNNDSDYSDENEKVLKKDILIGKRKEKKDKDKGYAALEGESSADENFKSRSPSKTKKAKPFKFSTKAKEKRDKSREKEKDLDKKKDRDKKNDKKQDKEKVKSEKTKKLKQSIDETADIGDILPIFGASLDVAVERSRCHDGVDIPLPIRECIDYVETVGMSFEGIYKISGTKSKVLQIRKMYNQRGNINLNDYDPPTVTSLVKTYLRDLPEPLFTNDLLIRFEEAGAILNLNTREKHLKILVDLLPPHNKTLLGWLITHLHNVSLNEKCNKMNKQAISTALNHTFHCSSRLLHALLHHCLALFPTITIARYVPPLESGAKLPDEPPEIETELKKQESLLTQIHKEMNVCCISKQREELLWEVQRIITQLKRKLKTANRDKEAVEKVEAPEPEAQPEEAASEEESELDGSVALLKFKNEGLLLLRDSLLKDIQAERGQIAVLRSKITGEVPPVAMVPNEDLDEVMDLFLKENQILQIKKINLVRQIIEEQEPNLSLKIVKPGESVTSLLSFTDVLTGNTNPYKTVSAKAIEDSTVVKLPMVAFQEIFHEYPDIFIRVIQVIMVRLQRVTFTALHQYLGLSAELVKQGPKSRNSKNPLVGGSPMKKKREDFRDGSFSSMDASQPIPVPGHRRSKSSLESKSFSPQTPDMVSDAEMATSGMTPDVALLQRKRHSVDNVDEDTLIEIATEAFIKELNLEDDTMLKGNVQIKEIAAGTYLMQEDSNKDVALCYVISGALIVSQKMTESEDEVHMFTSYHGEFVGGLAVLTGEPSFFTIRAKHFTRIALLSKNTFYSMMKDHPNIVLYVAHSVVQRLSPFVRQVDFALDWLFMESGRAVYRQDDESDSTYIVLSGRLRSVITHKNGKKELVGEYGKGDLIGVVEMVTHTKRSTTVIAVRDSELAKLPEGLFNAIKLKYPIVVTRLINLLGHRILGSWKKPTISVHAPSSSAIDSRPSQLNFSTVAIVAASDDVPLTAFTYELYHCLCAIGPTLRLTSDIIRKILGPTIMDPNNEYRLTSWLAQQEDQHKISLYQCDLTVSAWTQRCIRQADCILIVGLGENHPSIGKVEKEVERLAMRTQKELVLLHREGGKPHNTVAWINMRSWVAWHHHILSPNRMFSRKSLYRINELYSKVCQSEPNIHSDFSRLARWLTGKSVGLVLGGGGARGSAHVGMIKAIQEAGIPIDMVGGVSIGAFMGALWCRERNITTTTQKAREWSKKMTQWWRQILDLTYPMTSMFSGRDFNQTIKGTFGDTYIEDLWLPYFTVTTDITASCMRLHSHGSLWRYVRASMSLSGYMPPLCDPVDGHLLLDGGYTNNLPADVMRSLGANHIIAIDVGSVDDQDLTNYGDDLSGWWLLWKRWNPFTDPVKVPNLPDIQSRLAYVSCVRQLEEVKNSDYCEYVRPPIDKYKTLQFGSFDEIREVGYQHGKAYFEEKSKSGNLPIFKAPTVTNKPETEHILSDYTFTDLAQMVCKVSRPYEESSSSSSSGDEYEDGQDGYASEPTVCLMDNKIDKLLHMRRAGGSLSLSENEIESEVEFDVTNRKSEKELKFSSL